MEHRVTSRHFVRETCRKGSNTEEFERHVMAGSGNGAFYRAFYSKGRLGHHVYWTRLLSLNSIKSRVVTGLLNGYNTLRIHLYTMG
jgi:hypothetical protein